MSDKIAMMTNGNIKVILKGSKMAIPSPEDMGFCSGEESYLENEVHSPTDSSEDSVEVKVCSISLKNKRKLFEPRKTTESFTGPLKKRMCLKVKAENERVSNTPFRPWSPPQTKSVSQSQTTTSQNFLMPFPVKTEVVTSVVPTSAYFRPPSPSKYYQDSQTEPVALVIKRENDVKSDVPRVPIHPQVAKLSTAETERMILKTNQQFPSLQQPQPRESINIESPEINNMTVNKKAEQRREQRNYKNMTRERRIEANARERTRVHTISAAFETLRKSVPAYSHNQKLSKLSVLRIACSYIMTLSNLVDGDDEGTSEGVEAVGRTIQREGKLRKKKDDND